MNYTIGGNVSMSKKKYYTRPSGLVQLREHVIRFVEEQMTEDHMIGRSELTNQVMENLAEEIFIDVCRINDQVGEPTSISLGDSSLTNSERKFFYKRNKYNLNLLGEYSKIKVWLGATGRIARENFLLASEKYGDYHDNFFVNSIDRGMYRIECYRLVRGYTFDDMIRLNPSGVWFNMKSYNSTELSELKEKFVDDFRHKNKNGCLMTSIIEAFFTYITSHVHTTRYGKNVFYPNDCNPGNFVLDYDSETVFPYNVINIDFDHMTITNPKQMIHNMAWQFFSRIFDKETLPDSGIRKQVVEWRDSNDLFDQVEKFKKRYCETAKIEYSFNDCFVYDVTLSSLNGSKVLLDYVSELKETHKGQKNNGAVHNDKGQEVVYEINEDDGDDLE